MHTLTPIHTHGSGRLSDPSAYPRGALRARAPALQHTAHEPPPPSRRHELPLPRGDEKPCVATEAPLLVVCAEPRRPTPRRPPMRVGMARLLRGIVLIMSPGGMSATWCVRARAERACSEQRLHWQAAVP
jgi:hypothetical protein